MKHIKLLALVLIVTLTLSSCSVLESLKDLGDLIPDFNTGNGGGNIDTPPDDGGNTDTPPNDGGNTDTPPDDGGNTDTPPDDGNGDVNVYEPVVYGDCSGNCGRNIPDYPPEAYEEYEPKEYVDVSLDDHFDDNFVLVTLDKKISVIGEEGVPDIEFFGIDCIESIEEGSTRWFTDPSFNYNFYKSIEITLNVHSKEHVLRVVKYLEKIPGIHSVEPNRYFGYDSTANDEYYVSHSSSFANIDIEKVWDFTTGSSNVRVGVIDSGIASHPDLNGNVITGRDFVSNNDDNTITTDDTRGHGTMVAGVIGALGNNGLGVAGINWDVTIVPLQVHNTTGDGHLEFSVNGLTNAINYATVSYSSNNVNEQIRILNISLSSDGQMPYVKTAISSYPGLVICSTGNTGDNNDNSDKHLYPGFYGSSLCDNPVDNIITVGRVDENDAIPLDSNYGENTVSIFAPGENIATTYPQNMYDSNDSDHLSSGYICISGSSFSTPMVSGVAALLLSLDPSLTTAQLKAAILGGAEEIEVLTSRNGYQDVLRLNAARTVGKVFEIMIEPITVGDELVTTSGSINSSSDDFFENTLIKVIEITNIDSYVKFEISGDHTTSVKLYNANLEEIDLSMTTTNSGKDHEFLEALPNGRYYLRVSHLNNSSNGEIDISIDGRPHTHIRDECVYLSNSQHSYICICGFPVANSANYHTIMMGTAVNNHAYCIYCDGLIDLTNTHVWSIAKAIKVTVNGSYITESGIVVLAEADLEAYEDGTLIFYYPEDLPVTE